MKQIPFDIKIEGKTITSAVFSDGDEIALYFDDETFVHLIAVDKSASPMIQDTYYD